MAKVAETMSCARPTGVRLGALLAVLTALLAGLAHPTAGAAPQSPSRAPTEEIGTDQRTATVSITDLSPAVPDEADTLTIRGTVTNEGDSTIVGSSVDPRQGVPLQSRNAIDEAVSRTGFGDVSTDGAIISDHGQEVGTIPPGMSRTFALRVPVSTLGLAEEGVYQVGVTLTGQTKAEDWGDQILGAGRTVLPWQPAQDAGPQTDVTMLWPLISTTHLTAQTASDVEQTPALRDESLLAEISPGGRLHQLVTLGADLPVTWVIDPDLLASVEAMAEDYRFYADGDLVSGDGQEAARAWLLALQEAVSDNEVIALPFGDPDLASLAHRGEDVLGALGQFATATAMAAGTPTGTVDTVLDVTASTDFAWPVNGALDPAIVSVATSAGARNIIARSDSLRDDLPYTPTAARPIGGGTTAIVADTRLSTLFEGDMARTSLASRAQQQLLAQTLSITQQKPADERSIVIAPQRMPTADQASAMADAVRALQAEAGWVAFADLSDAAQAEPDPAATQEVPTQYPEWLRAQELPTSAFLSMRETQRTLEDFLVILTQPERVRVPFGNAILRQMSTSWRGNAAEAAEYRSSVQENLERLTRQVHLIQKSDITLSGRSATIPVTVQNNLVQDVQGLKLALTSNRRLGLEVSDPQEIAISGGHSQTVKFTTTARANGVHFLVAQLSTENGNKRYGREMEFQADVTSITSEVMMVIAGGLLLVALAGVRMYTQRKRTARAAASGQGDTATGPGGDSTDTAPKGERLGRNDPESGREP